MFHVLVVMCVGFTVQDKATLSKPLEVTLASFKTEEKPAQADYLAQQNQQGSGTQAEKTIPTTNNPAPFQDTVIRQAQNAIPPPARPESREKNLPNVVATSRSDHKAPKSPEEVAKKPVTAPTEHDSPPIDLREEVATLEALFNEQRQAYARRPRVKRLTAMSTLQEAGAFYKESWRRKVEKVGNINYPEQARKNHLYGELSLLVAINRDGSLDHVEVLKSSGYPVLDDAAMRIVRLAAPYAPFGDDLKDYDQVEIIRTWRFEPSDKLFSPS